MSLALCVSVDSFILVDVRAFAGFVPVGGFVQVAGWIFGSCKICAFLFDFDYPD